MCFDDAAGDFASDWASPGSLAPTARYVRQGFPVSVIPPAASCHLSGSAAACWHLLLTCGTRVSVGLLCPRSSPHQGCAPLVGGGTGTAIPHSRRPCHVCASTRLGERIRSGRPACWAAKPTTNVAAEVSATQRATADHPAFARRCKWKRPNR